jgi:hypothetical protein
MEIPKLARANLCALITLDVHARDMITGMVKAKVGFFLLSPLTNGDMTNYLP